MCCGLGVESTLKWIALLFFVLDIAFLLFMLYFYMYLFFSEMGSVKDETWYEKYVDTNIVTNYEEFMKIYAAIMFVVFPLFLVLCMTISKGYAWYR